MASRSHRVAGLLAGLACLHSGLFAAPALGAPFCVETMALPPQCIYTDAESCRARAAQLGGQCSANPDELTVRDGTGHYCLVTSARTVACGYTDLGNCDTEARRQHAVCVPAQGRPEAPSVDPYRTVRPSMAGG